MQPVKSQQGCSAMIKGGSTPQYWVLLPFFVVVVVLAFLTNHRNFTANLTISGKIFLPSIDKLSPPLCLCIMRLRLLYLGSVPETESHTYSGYLLASDSQCYQMLLTDLRTEVSRFGVRVRLMALCQTLITVVGLPKI